MFDVKRPLGKVLESSVWRALGVYAVSAWITLLLVQVLTATAGLPEWFPELALGLLLLGLPPVLTIAYLRDPSGRESREGGDVGAPGTDEVTPAEASPRPRPPLPNRIRPARRGRRLLVVLLAAVVLGALAAGWHIVGPGADRWRGSVPPGPRVALLPYVHTSPPDEREGVPSTEEATEGGTAQATEEGQALAGALHRDLFRRLAGLGGLVLLSPEAVEMMGLGSDADPAGEGNLADVLIEVELERGDSGTLLHARLIDSRGRTRGTGTFGDGAGREVGSGGEAGAAGEAGSGREAGSAGALLSSQAELALWVLESLRVTPTEAERSRLEAVPTEDMEAFLLYARGLFARELYAPGLPVPGLPVPEPHVPGGRTRGPAEARGSQGDTGTKALEGAVAAERLFMEATDRDPSFGPAWSALSEVRSDILLLAHPRPLPPGGHAAFPSATSRPSEEIRDAAWERGWEGDRGRDRERDRERAWLAADRALRLDPEDPLARLAMGNLHFRSAGMDPLGGLERAVIEYRRAAAGLPGFAPVHRALGEVERRTGQWDRALASWRRAVQLDPGVPWSRFELGHTFFLLRRYGEALSHLEAAATMAPELDAAHVLLVQTRLSQWGDLDSAHVALEALPDPDRLPLLRFQTHFLARDFGAAAAVASSHLPERMAAPCAVFTPSRMLGTVLAFTGQVEGSRARLGEARDELEGDLSRNPHDPRPLASLGEVLALRGDTAPARQAAERAARLMPAGADAVEGPACAAALARTLVLAGRLREALDLLEWIMAVPGPTTTGELRFDPTWDPVRSDPRFQRLVESEVGVTGIDP